MSSLFSLAIIPLTALKYCRELVMQDFLSFHIICLIIANKALKHWFNKTCLKQITASFRNNSIFFLIHVYVGFPPLSSIWLHFFLTAIYGILSHWQNWFKYFWTLQVLCRFTDLPLIASGAFHLFCWAGWQVQPAFPTQGKTNRFCRFCHHFPQQSCWKAEEHQPSSWQHIIAQAHFVGTSTVGTYGAKCEPANHFQLSWSLRPWDTSFSSLGCSKHITTFCGIFLFPDLYPLQQKENSSSRLIGTQFPPFNTEGFILNLHLPFILYLACTCHVNSYQVGKGKECNPR